MIKLSKETRHGVCKLWFLVLILFLASCASKKDVLYFQGIESENNLGNIKTETRIQSNDLLSVIVSAENREVAEPFNLPAINIQTAINSNIPSQENQAYLVDSNGFIEMPKIGAIKVSGLTKIEAIALIKDKINPYLKTPPVITLRILNFRVTVLGDVKNPGTFSIPSEQVTLLEAIGYAGDLSITGDRQGVTVIRTSDEGNRSVATFDLTKNDLFSSPYFNLKQNDVVVVDPNYYQVQRASANPNTGIFVSVASLILSVLVIFLR